MRIRSVSFFLLAVLTMGCEPASPVYGPTVEVTAANFDALVTQSEVPVLVDFWAEWCGPCRDMEPVIASVASRYEGQLVVGKVNVDEQPELADRFGINGIPAMLLFRQGELVRNLVGGRSEQELVGEIEPFLAAGPAPR
ncbi:MAG: thioredoxin [Planctomycetales bacterium]|nr:thioredoxin [Planctomycetales bacterium]